jgi:histone-lysine N-methyltransferase SUV420H
LFREGKYITFRVLRPILIGEEITAHYGHGYCTCSSTPICPRLLTSFSVGRKNRHCLCETCERNGRGGYAPDYDENEPEPNSSSDSDTDSTSSSSDSDSEPPDVNINERRTRRGVYAILQKGTEHDTDESDEEDSEKVAIELSVEVDAGTSVSATPQGIQSQPSPSPATANSASITRSLSSLSSLSSDAPEKSGNVETRITPFRSIIATRRQKARAEAKNTKSQSAPSETSSRGPQRTMTRSSSHTSERGGGREKMSTPTASHISKRTGDSKEEVKVKKEEVEPRNLRARPSATQLTDSAKVVPTKEVPRGPDGKPLPLCVTCSNVLPVISVNSKVVWGLGLENSSKKKKLKSECPRLVFHRTFFSSPHLLVRCVLQRFF